MSGGHIQPQIDISVDVNVASSRDPDASPDPGLDVGPGPGPDPGNGSGPDPGNGSGPDVGPGPGPRPDNPYYYDMNEGCKKADMNDPNGMLRPLYECCVNGVEPQICDFVVQADGLLVFNGPGQC